MTVRRRWVLMIPVLAAACGTSPSSRFYALEPTATAESAAPADYAVGVGSVSIPAAVARSQIVVQVAPNRVAIDDFNRWSAPLEDNIARVVALDLAALLGTPRVARLPLANFEPDFRVTLDVQRFESVPGQSALVEVVWTVRAADGRVRTGRTLAREAAQGAGYDALAAAHSRALAAVGRDIAGAIRAQAQSR